MTKQRFKVGDLVVSNHSMLISPINSPGHPGGFYRRPADTLMLVVEVFYNGEETVYSCQPVINNAADMGAAFYKQESLDAPGQIERAE